MRKILTAAMALGVLASAGVANAQPGPHRHDDHGDRHDDRYERHASHRYHANRYAPPRGYKAHVWRHGDRLPAEYRSRAYVVDYRRYRLAPPPPGYDYIRVGDDVVLAALATGLVSTVIYQMFE